MSTIATAVEEYEGKVLDFVKNAKDPVTDFVGKAVDRLVVALPDGKLPTVELPTPPKFVQDRTEFVKQLVDANAELVSAVYQTLATKATASEAPVAKATKPAAKVA